VLTEVSRVPRAPIVWLLVLGALGLSSGLGGRRVVFAQADPRAALLERAGWQALASGRAREAADAFREALATDPRSARLHLGAAAAAFVERRDADARDALERALGLDPRLAEARTLLGQVLHRMGDVAGAIRAYELLAADRPLDAEVGAALDRWRRELDLHDRMQQAVGSHFRVSFEGPAEEALALQALASLERAYWRIGAILGTYPADPVGVVLYTREQFRDITRSPAWAVGAYDGIIRIPMRGAGEKPSELDRVLAHEFTHALVRSLASRGVPTWLNEGLASALEADGPTAAERAVSRQGTTMPLRALSAGFGRLSAADAQTAYGVSAAAVRRLVEEAGGVAVANLLRDLGSGADFEAAFLRRMQRSFDQFQRQSAAP
jgi:tetratricopeptide (TPR) repeat protein